MNLSRAGTGLNFSGYKLLRYLAFGLGLVLVAGKFGSSLSYSLLSPAKKLAGFAEILVRVLCLYTAIFSPGPDL